MTYVLLLVSLMSLVGIFFLDSKNKAPEKTKTQVVKPEPRLEEDEMNLTVVSDQTSNTKPKTIPKTISVKDIPVRPQSSIDAEKKRNEEKQKHFETLERLSKKREAAKLEREKRKSL